MVTVEEWVKRFRAVGLDDAAMQNWHRLFERENPEGHQSFPGRTLTPLPFAGYAQSRW